jgi:alpha-tubulin suppressor-like RCC1 family protein
MKHCSARSLSLAVGLALLLLIAAACTGSELIPLELRHRVLTRKHETLSEDQTATLVVAGYSHNCIITANGGVKCWGGNGNGQLGNGTNGDRDRPVEVIGLAAGSGVTALATGDSHTCAVTAGGGVKCWGSNSSGQLGDGTLTDRSAPVQVTGLPSGSGVTALAAGGAHTCALTPGGGVKCWGANGSGQLGDGTLTDRTTPVQVIGPPSGSGVTALAAGGAHTCALTPGGGVKCWGANGSGQLGDWTFIEKSAPAEVSGLPTGSGVLALAAGGAHTCVVTAGGGVVCWGLNRSGQLGNGTNANSSTLVGVSGIPAGSEVKALAAGLYHTCALTARGTVKCWGSGGLGQLGNGPRADNNTPEGVSMFPPGSGVAGLAAGGDHTCALTAGGSVKCWGG